MRLVRSVRLPSQYMRLCRLHPIGQYVDHVGILLLRAVGMSERTLNP